MEIKINKESMYTANGYHLETLCFSPKTKEDAEELKKLLSGWKEGYALVPQIHLFNGEGEILCLNYIKLPATYKSIDKLKLNTKNANLKPTIERIVSGIKMPPTLKITIEKIISDMFKWWKH